MNRAYLWVVLIALAPGLSKAGQLNAQGAKKQATLVSKPAAVNPADLVGSDVCATCHADVAKKFDATNPHSKLALEHGGKGVTCESCHGPGRAHVEGGGDVTKIVQLNKLSAKDLSATCLGCHAGAHPNFDRSPHAKAGVSCISCHSIHTPEAEAKLLKVDQPKLCYQCHAEIKPQFSQPFHHRVDEGLMKCSDCHDVHGTFGANNVRSTADQNAICTKCHTETRGPFVFEHAAVKAEGCVGCHTPHGSQNARLLNVPNINQLCNQCHSPVSGSTVHGINAGSADVTPCISCHTMIHGSNVNPAFIR
jgi:DmsE family decaheme c-type cytochrome